MIHLVALNPSLDLHFDLDPSSRDKVGIVRSQEILPGGKALNVARFLRVLRVPACAWVAGVGDAHPTQTLYRDLLRRTDPRLEVRPLPSKSAVRFNLHLTRGADFEKHNHPGFAPAPQDLRSALQAIRNGSRPGEKVVLTGRLPQGAPDHLYRDWILSLQADGRSVILDTSGAPLARALDARPFFVKVNLQEMGGALGRRLPNLQALRPLLPGLVRRGVSRGAVTDGPRGALAWEGERAVWVRPTRPRRGAGVVGAGDAFLAGWLSVLEAPVDLTRRTAWAVACGREAACRGIFGFRPPRGRA